MSKIFAAQINKLPDNKELSAVFEYLCSESNKRVANIKEDKPHGFWCKLRDKTTTKRNRQMRDAVNKAASIVINHCLDHDIGTIVMGWNKGQKQNSSID